MDTHKAHKAVRAARLAISEELGGNEGAAIQAGKTAGRLAAIAGLTLTELDTEAGKLCIATLAWDAAVDAWYEEQPKDVTADEFDLVHNMVQASMPQDAADIVARMWAELQRRRGM